MSFVNVIGVFVACAYINCGSATTTTSANALRNFGFAIAGLLRVFGPSLWPLILFASIPLKQAIGSQSLLQGGIEVARRQNPVGIRTHAQWTAVAIGILSSR